MDAANHFAPTYCALPSLVAPADLFGALLWFNEIGAKEQEAVDAGTASWLMDGRAAIALAAFEAECEAIARKRAAEARAREFFCDGPFGDDGDWY